MRIWIDLANSPHPLFFAPVARKLEEMGHEILVTARGHAQTVALTLERWPEADVLGGRSPGSRLAKARSISERAVALRGWAQARRPAVAVSHNSYAQLVAARSLRIRAVTAMDYEHQPANHLAFRLARTVLMPELLPGWRTRWQGATAGKVVRYPGLKEELYLGDFTPDQDVLKKLGLQSRPRTVVVARTPPGFALYHRFQNPLFEAAIRSACEQPGVVCVVLPRHADEVAAIQALGLRNCITPGLSIDARSLLYAADAVIGGGGTMTREAALLGLPTWSVFAGRVPAVERWLEGQGRLTRLQRADQLTALGPRRCEPIPPCALRRRGAAIEQVIVGAVIGTGAGLPGHRSNDR